MNRHRLRISRCIANFKMHLIPQTNVEKIVVYLEKSCNGDLFPVVDLHAQQHVAHSKFLIRSFPSRSSFRNSNRFYKKCHCKDTTIYTLPRGEGVTAQAVTGEERRKVGSCARSGEWSALVRFLPAFLIRPYGAPSPREKVLLQWRKIPVHPFWRTGIAAD